MTEFVNDNFSITWHPIKTPNNDIVWVDNPDVWPIIGATYIPNFLSHEQATALLEQLDKNPYQQIIRRRQQFYGPTYYHTTHDLIDIQPTGNQQFVHSLDFKQLDWLVEMFYNHSKKFSKFNPKSKNSNDNNKINVNVDIDRNNNVCYYNEIFKLDGSNSPTQCLVNEYIANCGISSHFDDSDAFGDVIATVSLVNPVHMTLKLPKEATNYCEDILKETRILLEPNSLFVFKDNVRYKWRHGITKHKLVFLPNNKGILKRNENYRRVSLTIRKLLNTRKKSIKNDFQWVDPKKRRPIPIDPKNKYYQNVKNKFGNDCDHDNYNMINNRENDNLNQDEKKQEKTQSNNVSCKDNDAFVQGYLNSNSKIFESDHNYQKYKKIDWQDLQECVDILDDCLSILKSCQ